MPELLYSGSTSLTPSVPAMALVTLSGFSTGSMTLTTESAFVL